jgi:hypothetical protein
VAPINLNIDWVPGDIGLLGGRSIGAHTVSVLVVVEVMQVQRYPSSHGGVASALGLCDLEMVVVAAPLGRCQANTDTGTTLAGGARGRLASLKVFDE